MRNGGFVLVDDCNHDVNGLYAKSFEKEMASIFGADALKKLPKDPPDLLELLQVRRTAAHRRTSSTAGATTSSTST